MDRRHFLAALGAGTLAAMPLLQACVSQSPAAKPADSSAGAAARAPQTQTSAGQAPGADAGGPVRGGQLEVIVQNDWVNMDALFSTAGATVPSMVCGEWIRWEKDAAGRWGPQPDLVAEWDQKPDQVTLKLQSGVKFHDGTAWDAKAAKWNLDRMAFHPSSGMKSFLRAIDRSNEDESELDRMKEKAATTFDFSSKAVEVVDDSAIRIHLGLPAPGFIAIISSAVEWTNPVSPDAYNKQGKDVFARNPVGAGPFRFVEWQSGDHILLERNPTYWKKGADGQLLPYLDRIRYRLVIDDSARLLELRSGNAHFMELAQGKDIAVIKADPNLMILESEDSGNNYRMIFDSTNPDSPLAKHKELRQAMLYAMDREAMAKTLGFSAGVGRKYLLPKGSFAYDPSEQRPHYWFDKAKAEQLVKDTIAKDSSVASGGKVPLTLSAIDRAVDKAQAEMIKQMGEAVGFAITLEVTERAAWTAKLVKRPGQPGGKFDFATMRNPVISDDPDGQWRTFFHSAGSFNVAHLEDPGWDKPIDTAAATPDQEQRKALYAQIDQKYFDDPWYGFLWQQNWNWPHSKKLKNFQEQIAGRLLFTETWLN